MASNGLQEFRAKSKIDLESFSRKFHTDDLLEYKRRIWARLEADPLFDKNGESFISGAELKSAMRKMGEEFKRTMDMG